MPLAHGARIGAFEIVGQLGAGGSGEVYRATDTNLGRQVAIKILPAEFATDAERVARFEREGHARCPGSTPLDAPGNSLGPCVPPYHTWHCVVSCVDGDQPGPR